MPTTRAGLGLDGATMTCGSCGRANRATARFCGGCGKPLAPRCPTCGAESEPDAQFCDVCGTSLVARPVAEAAVARKVVTTVFADLIGSTALHERLDAESARRLMDHYYRALRAAVETHGGTVVKLLGDGVMAAFGVPRVAEDDAVRAVRAAIDMQRAFREVVREQGGMKGDIGLRVAVNTGEVVVSADHTDVVGDPVNVAARLQQEAHDGDVLIGESTRRLVSHVMTLAPFGALTLKGRSEKVAAYRVVSLDRPADAPTTAFVGRDDELRRLVAVYDAAVTARGARLAVILGSPGLGKSRLLGEFTRRLGDAATVLTANCDAAGGATFVPLARALRALLRVDDGSSGDALRTAIIAALPDADADRTRIAEGINALLAGSPASPEETFFVVRRLLAGLAAKQPVLFTIDDLQWAEPLLLDLVEHLVQWSTDVPLLVVVAARPELRDTRSSLAAADGLVADVVTLSGLDAGAATRLAANVIGAEALPAAVAGRVLATSEGNPLFVGELVRMLVHDGALKREGDRWSAGVELASLEMPPTIHAVLAARIERLRAEDRLVLERAAVVGRQFSRAAVAHLLPREAQADLDARLESLRRGELIEPDAAWFLGEPGLRFRHGLIRDAAYRRLLKGTRAELHGRCADWIETKVGDSIEHEETIGWHLEQAHQHLRELGPVDAQGQALGDRAARYLAAAGRRALTRDDLSVAGSLLGRAFDRLDAADPARADLALDWCEALLAAGDVGHARAAIDELGRFIDMPVPATSPRNDLSGVGTGVDRLRAWHTCFAGQLAVLTDPQALHATADVVAAAADELASVRDAAGEAKAHSVHATALARLGKVGACEAALDQALAAARRAHDRRRANAVLAGAPLAALWGPSPVTRASGRCLDVVRVLRITQGAPAVEAVALRCQGVLEALRGRTEAARRMIASSRRMVEELGITQRLLEADVFAGLIELIEGNAVAAERCLRSAYEGLREHGLGIDAAQAAALLGRALLAQGRAAEAEALSHESEALAGDDLKAAIAWRGVRAEALAQRGEHPAAVELARAAVDIAAATDALLDHADARLALAIAWRAAGRSNDAHAEEARAIELWEAKGATLLVERAHRAAGRVVRTDRDRHAPAAPTRPAARRLPANAATTNAAQMDAAVAARDLDAFMGLLADGAESAHRPTSTVYYERDAADSYRSSLAADDAKMLHEPLATLGNSLALCRSFVSFSASGVDDAPFGAVPTENILLIEVDAHGQRVRTEFFALDRLGDAVARLYERYADLLPDGPGRARAAATANSIAAMVGPPNLDRYGAAFATDVEFVDHRTLGFGAARGAERMLSAFRALFEMADDISVRVDDILGLEAHAFVRRLTTAGTARAGGGAYERHYLELHEFGVDGLLRRVELFDVGCEAAALARFDELSASPLANRFTNAATRANQRMECAWRARAWDDLVTSFAPTLVMNDRRSVVGLAVTGEDFLTNLRVLFAMRSSRWHSNVLATRGERLALCRTSFAAEATSGAEVVVEHLAIIEVDADGRYDALVLFDSDALAAAYDELDRRYAAGEGAPYAELLAHWRAFRQASDHRDWQTARRLLPDDFTMFSHCRLASTGRRMSRDGFIASLGWGDDRGVRSVMRRDHLLRLSAGAAVEVATLQGNVDGGDFEQQIVLVATHDGSRLGSFEAFDLDQLDVALARYDELAAGPPTATRIENAATRAVAQAQEAWKARDWKRFAALFAPSYFHVDRRMLVRLELGRDPYLDSIRPFFEMAAPAPTMDVLATRGNTLAMVRAAVRVDRQDTGDLIGHGELAFVGVIEVNGDGDQIAMVQFDLNDLDAAYVELDDRYAAIAAASSRRTTLTRAFTQAFAARDWHRLSTLLAPDLVVHDHRLLGWETLHGPAAYIDALRSLVDLAPDVQLRIDHTMMSGDRFLYVTTWVGTREGGPFESPSAILCELDGAGRIRQFDQYDLDRLDDVRARFAASGAGGESGSTLRDGPEVTGPPHGDRKFPLQDDYQAVRTEEPPSVGGVSKGAFATRSPAGPDPLRIPPNAATRASDLYEEAREALDLEAIAAMCAPTMLFDDRRRGLRVTGDRETFIVSNRLIISPRLRASRTVLATMGDHLALRHIRWTGTTADGVAFENENLSLMEVDAEGRIAAIISFDADDRRAASLEMFERYARGDAAQLIPAAAFEGIRAMNDHDVERLRALISDDFVFDDHRRTGIGRLEGAAASVASLAALLEQVQGLTIETLYTVATEKHGELVMAHTFGILASGGEFEAVYARLGLYQDDRIVAMELFEPEDLDVARARLEELRPDPLRIPPNAATRANERCFEPIMARDWSALRALTSADFTFDDRRKRALVHGDIELWIRNLEVVLSWGVTRRTRELIGTVGDRIAVERFAFFAGEGEAAIDGEFLRLTETDAAGRLRAVIHLDLDDRRAAFDEAQARFINGEAAGCPAQALIQRFGATIARHDWDELRKYFVAGLVCSDRRKLSFSEIPSEKLIESLYVLSDLGPDVGGEMLQILAWNHYGRVAVIRQFGTTRDGGSFESVFVPLVVVRGDQIVAYEIFEVGDADQAVARFAELCASLRRSLE